MWSKERKHRAPRSPGRRSNPALSHSYSFVTHMRSLNRIGYAHKRTRAKNKGMIFNAKDFFVHMTNLAPSPRANSD